MRTPQRGEPLSIEARDWTTVLELVKKQRNGEINFRLGDLESAHRSATRVKVVNDGSLLDQGAVVGLGEVIITPSQNLQEFIANFAFRTVTPTTNGKWGVIQEPCPTDEIATAVIAGVTACKVNFSDANHRCAEQNGTANLVSQWCGTSQILWKEAGTGLLWSIIRIGLAGPRWFVGTVDGAIAAGSTGTVVASGTNYSVKNEASQTVPDEAKVGVAWDDLQNLYVISMEFC